MADVPTMINKAAVDPIIEAAKRLIDSVEFDVNGHPITKGGHGGLVSKETLQARDELRMLISRYENG